MTSYAYRVCNIEWLDEAAHLPDVVDLILPEALEYIGDGADPKKIDRIINDELERQFGHRSHGYELEAEDMCQASRSLHACRRPIFPYPYTIERIEWTDARPDLPNEADVMLPTWLVFSEQRLPLEEWKEVINDRLHHQFGARAISFRFRADRCVSSKHARR